MKKEIKILGIILIMALMIVYIFSFYISGALSKNDKRNNYDENSVAKFIEIELYGTVLIEGSSTSDLWGINANMIDSANNYDEYQVCGNVQLINSHTNEKTWNSFTVDVYVYHDDIITQNWRFS
jgi:hypothetical protein